jgi:DNA-binding NtrC family response regulator
VPLDPRPIVIGGSQTLRSALALADRFARIPRPVVLLGPSGVGKGLFARWMHAASGRVGAFVALTGGQVADTLLHDQLFGHVRGGFTGAIVAARGVFTRAESGTLFLDELPHWSRLAQAAILRAIDEREVLPVGGQREVPLSGSVIIGTNRALDDLVVEGVLLPDLRWRLGAFLITLAPLADRPLDIALLAYHFLDTARAEFPCLCPIGFTADALARLMRERWPGNARQLRTVVERAAVEAAGKGLIEVEHLGLVAGHPGSDLQLSRADHHALLDWAIARAAQDRRTATSILGVHRNTIAYHRTRMHKNRGVG